MRSTANNSSQSTDRESKHSAPNTALPLHGDRCHCQMTFASDGLCVVTLVTTIYPPGSTMIETGTLNEEANYSGLANEQ
jgi:hypothetical protein